MDIKIINAFVEAGTEAFDQMFSISPQAGTPVAMDNLADHHWDVSGVVGITGAGKGMVVLRLPRDLVNQLLDMSGMATDDPIEAEDMTNALVGEIANVVSGHTINKLADWDLDITVPLVVQGKNHRINWPKFAPVFSVPITTSLGVLEMAVCFAQN